MTTKGHGTATISLAHHQTGDTGDDVSQAGEGHTTDLLPGSIWWADPLGPFVYSHLHLGS